MRIPLLFANPRLFSHARIKSFSGLKDIAPTILAVLGEAPPTQWQGINVLGDKGQNRVFSFAPWSGFYFGLRDGNVKYIFEETSNTVEVYDLAADPHETINLAQERGNEVELARQRVAAWVQYQDRYINEILKSSSTAEQ